MILGNFLSDANTPFILTGWNPGCFYYLDDVSLVKIAKPNSVKELDVSFGISPNPVADAVRIDYRGNLKPIGTRLFAVEGRQVFFEPWQKSLDVLELSEGLYLLQIDFDNGAVGTQRLVITR
jgi:hypothetical protein